MIKKCFIPIVLLLSGCLGIPVAYAVPGEDISTIENLHAESLGINSALSSEDSPDKTSEEDRLFGDVTGQSRQTSRAAGFVGRVDAHWAHESAGEVSGHVSWTLVRGTSRKLKVTSSLRVKTSLWGYATKAGPTSASVYPGGGRGKAAVARFRCKSIASNTWWTYGEAFAPGSNKPFGTHASQTQKLKCGYK